MQLKLNLKFSADFMKNKHVLNLQSEEREKKSLVEKAGWIELITIV